MQVTLEMGKTQVQTLKDVKPGECFIFPKSPTHQGHSLLVDTLYIRLELAYNNSSAVVPDRETCLCALLSSGETHVIHGITAIKRVRQTVPASFEE